MKTTKELRGEHGAATVAYYRLMCELPRGYRKDPVGQELCMGWLKDIREFLDDMEKPLEFAQDFDDACDLRGIHRFGLDTINRALAVLLPLKDRLEGTKNRLTVIRKEGA